MDGKSGLEKLLIEYKAVIGHFTVVGLAVQPLSEREAEVELVLIQTPFFF